MIRETNAPFGPAAGSPNWAQGGAPNRWRYDDEIIRQSRAELFGEPMMQVLPNFAPYHGEWGGNGGIMPEDVDPYGPAEELDRNVWGGFYYGYHPYAAHGYDPSDDDASYATMPLGYTDPLYDPTTDMWHYAAPSEVQPQVEEVNPWHAAVARFFSRGVPAHNAFSRSGHGGGYAQGYETIGFDGSSG